LKNTLLAIILFVFFTPPAKGDTSVHVSPFQCEMSASTNQQLNHGVILNFTITNITDHSLKLLTWYTPLEGFLSKLFIIKNEIDETLNYNGMMVKRSTPTNEDYLVLATKEKVKITLNLTQAYSFIAGEYTVQLSPKNWQYIQDKTLLTTQCLANKLKIKVTSHDTKYFP